LQASTSLETERSQLLLRSRGEGRQQQQQQQRPSSGGSGSSGGNGGGKDEERVDWLMTALLFLFPALGGLLFG
jgi:hypothetical protein